MRNIFITATDADGTILDRDFLEVSQSEKVLHVQPLTQSSEMELPVALPSRHVDLVIGTAALPVTNPVTVKETGRSVCIDDNDYSELVESTGNTFLVLSSYLSQDAGDIVSPYDNGKLVWDD
jgi:hypothetical protein